MRLIYPLFLSTISATVVAEDNTLSVVVFNVESGGANIQSIAEKCARMEGVDILGLSEVESQQWAKAIEAALEMSEQQEFSTAWGTTGRQDALCVVYDDSELDLIGMEELHDINPQRRVRSPLVCYFRHTKSGTEFAFCVNHLYRSKDAERHKQAQQLNEWVKSQRVPVIIGGDMNFDWSVANNGQHRDKGFDNLTANGVVEWVRPSNIIKTHASNYNSILDFIFVTPNGPWTIEQSEIVVEDGDFPDNGWTSDHRPVAAVLKMGTEPNTGDDESNVQDAPDPIILALQESLEELDAAIQKLQQEAAQLSDSDPEQRTLKRMLLSRLERMHKDAERLGKVLDQAADQN